MGGVKLSLDLAIGETSKIESEDKSKIESIVGKVKELNGRLVDVRREQVFQRVSSYGWCSVWKLTLDRNEKPNSEIKVKLPIPELCDGLWYSWVCWALLAPGNCRICGHSSSSRSLHDHPSQCYNHFHRAIMLTCPL